MVKVQSIKELLTCLVLGDDSELVRSRYDHLMEDIQPQDIALAQQQLLESGIGVSNFGALCAAHMEAFRNYHPENILALPKNHVLNKIINEHEMILCFASELETLNKEIQRMQKYDEGNICVKQLALIVRHLMLADERHYNQDKVILYELEERKYYGPAQIMKIGHININYEKIKLKDLVNSKSHQDFRSYKKDLNAVIEKLVPMINEFIFFEDHILYPIALDLITDSNVWDRINTVFEEMGYSGLYAE